MFDVRPSGGVPSLPDQEIESRVQSAVRSGRLQIVINNLDRRPPREIQEEIAGYLALKQREDLSKIAGSQQTLLSFPASLERFKSLLARCQFRTPHVNLEALQEHSAEFFSAHFKLATRACFFLCTHRRTGDLPLGIDPEIISKTIQHSYWLLRDAFSYFEKHPQNGVTPLNFAEDDTTEEKMTALRDALGFSAMTIIAEETLGALGKLNTPSADRFILSLDPSHDPYFEEYSRSSLARALALLATRTNSSTEALTRLTEMARIETIPFVKERILEALFEHSADPAIREAILQGFGRGWNTLGRVVDLIAREFPAEEVPAELKSAVRYYAWAPREELETLLTNPNEAPLLEDRIRKLKGLLDQKETNQEPFKGRYGEFTARPLSVHEQRNCAEFFGIDLSSGSLGWSPWLNTRVALCTPLIERPCGMVILDEIRSRATGLSWEISQIAIPNEIQYNLRPGIVTAALAAALDLAMFNKDPRPVLYRTTLWGVLDSGNTDRIAGMPIERFIPPISPH